MQELNLPTYKFRLKKENQNTLIFDEIRNKFLVLTPEEWVRQHFIMYLIYHKNFPKALISIESGFTINKRQKRSDILIYNREGKSIVLVECKAPSVKISQKTFDQIVSYNIKYQVKYLLVTNGLQHYGCLVDYKTGNYQFLQDIPDYSDL